MLMQGHELTLSPAAFVPLSQRIRRMRTRHLIARDHELVFWVSPLPFVFSRGLSGARRYRKSVLVPFPAPLL